MGGDALRGNSICGSYLLCLYLYNLKSKTLNPKVKYNNLRIGHENKNIYISFSYYNIMKIIIIWFFLNKLFFYLCNIYIFI